MAPDVATPGGTAHAGAGKPGSGPGFSSTSGPGFSSTGLSGYKRYFNTSTNMGRFGLLMAAGAASSQAVLVKQLLENYDKTLRPVRNVSTTTFIGVHAELILITSISEPTESISFVAFLAMYWSDELLLWNPSENDGIDQLFIPISRIWYPDVGSHNVIDMKQLVPDEQNLAKIDNLGNVIMVQDQVVTMHCTYDVVNFPFDVQNCTMKIGSWMQTSRQITLFHKNITAEPFSINSEWDLISFNSRTGSVVDEGKSTDFIVIIFFDIVIQRKPEFYLTTFMLPSFIITTLAMVGIFSPCSEEGHREEKVTMGLTTLLTMAVILLLITDQMPASSTGIPLLGQFMLKQIGLSALASLTSVLLMYQHKRWITRATVPRWLLAKPEKIVDISGMAKSLKSEGMNGAKYHELIGGLMEIIHLFMKIVLDKQTEDHYHHMWGKVLGRLDIMMMIVFIFLNIASTAIFLVIGYSCLVV